MYICGCFALSNGPNREVLWIISIFGVVFGQNVCFWPPGVCMYRVTPHCYAINFEEITLSWMYICDCFALSNGSNREVLWIIPIFGVLFGQNMGIWPPGVPIYRVTPRFFAIYFEEIVSRFVLNVTFLIFRIFERSEMSKNDYFDYFWSKIRRLTPWGDNKGSYPLGWSYFFNISSHILGKTLV